MKTLYVLIVFFVYVPLMSMQKDDMQPKSASDRTSKAEEIRSETPPRSASMPAISANPAGKKKSFKATVTALILTRSKDACDQPESPERQAAKEIYNEHIGAKEEKKTKKETKREEEKQREIAKFMEENKEKCAQATATRSGRSATSEVRKK